MRAQRAGWKPLLAVMLPAVAGWLAGCSDNSPLHMYVDGVTGNSGAAYMDVDLVGGSADNCAPQVDLATASVRLEQPGLFGPALYGFITGYRVEFFYIEPASGSSVGPVSWLAFSESNMRDIIYSTATVSVPVATFQVKAWASGAACNGIAGHSGGVVRRMVARITILGEDATGKKLSAQGNISMYLNDLPPYPTAAGTTDDTWCYKYYAFPSQAATDPGGYWTDVCR